MQDKNELLAQLKDIRGLDPFPWWPIAPGWWMLLGFILLSVTLGYMARQWFWDRYRARFWLEEARKTIQDIRNDKRRTDQQRVASLAVLLRKLAIRKHGRAACAGLEGQDWLRWLKSHDPKGFDWLNEGRLLIEAPYAPEGKPIRASLIEHLISGVEGWVR